MRGLICVDIQLSDENDFEEYPNIPSTGDYHPLLINSVCLPLAVEPVEPCASKG
jgi:hypothetical protein